jgi:hypothetical protein
MDGGCSTVLPYLCDNGVCGTFIDWRGSPIVHSAATKLALVPLNLIVWAKTNAGMGSLYRSQHELLPPIKKGSAPHINNVELGKRGHWGRSVTPWSINLSRLPRQGRVRIWVCSQREKPGELGSALSGNQQLSGG